MSLRTAPPGVTVRGNDWSGVDLSGPAPAVSVVVCHYEQHEELARTLAALRRQTHPAPLLEVVVVDDGSRRTPVVPDGVRLVRRADQGFTAAAARNAGVLASSHPVLVFLDADTTPEPDFVAEMARLPARLPEAVVVGRRRHAALAEVPVADPVEVAGPRHELPEPTWLRDAYARTGDLLRADETSYRFVISAVLACHRWLFDLTGGFDETFRQYGGEDWEWASRAWREGAVLAHAPRAVAWHDGPDAAGRADMPTKLHETVRLAHRIPSAPAAFGGLLLGPPELVVTLGDELSLTEQLISADSLLQAVPTAAVRASPALYDAVGRDPRIRPDADDPDAALCLELHAGVHGPADAWQALLAPARGVDHAGTVTLRDDRGVLAEVRSLRAHRRMRRWQRPELFPAVEVASSALQRVPPSLDLERYLGGW